MTISVDLKPHEHEWVVFSTFVEDGSLFVQCVDCGAAGTVDDPSRKEWKRAFHAPSRPYRWHDETRINQRGTRSLHVIRTIPCQQCECPSRRRADAQYERFPAEIVTPEVALTAQEKAELQELADFVRESDLCSYWFPFFVRSYERDTGHCYSPAVHTITDRIERIDQMTLHCSPAVVARALTEFVNTPPQQLPARDNYWLLHNGQKYAQHGTEDKNGVLVFSCQELAEQFLLTVGKALPEFKPVKVSFTTFFEEAQRAGAFAVPEGSLKVRVCEIKEE